MPATSAPSTETDARATTLEHEAHGQLGTTRYAS